MDPQGTVGSQEGDSLSDIQSYLVNFNKEICSGSQGYVLTSAIQQKSTQNAYVVANAENQLYDGNILHDVSEDSVTTLKTEESEKKTKLERSEQQLLDQEETIFESRNAKMSSEASTDDLLRAVTNGDTAPSLITIQPDQCAVSGPDSGNARQETNVDQEDGNNTYQTVTIVPSEVNQGGEVSYVLIVSQNEHQSKAADDVDMSVYDFKEENRTNIETNTDHGDRNTPRKSYRTSIGRKPAVQMSSQLMCNYCNYTSTKKYLLTRHMKTHSDERPHKCHICERAFKTVASLQNHINTHTGVHPHKCKECDAAFTTSGELVRHVRYRHTYEKPHRCPECDYASVELSKLKRHMRSHTGERPYQCPHCVYASPDTYKLKRHLRIHTGEKPYECDICHTRFTQSNSLKAHRLIHTGEKPVYQCELCPTTCSRKTDLKFHVRKLHTSDTPLQCKKCGKSFPDRYTWKIHLKTHEGEKCFRCELCPYAALSQRHLESHLLTHTGEKPFECDQCEMSFRQKQLLKRHKNLYHNPDYVPPTPKDKIHQCPDCDKSFAHKGNLLRHRAGHDPDNQEYQQALENYRAEQGEEYDEEAEEEEEQDQSMSEDLIVRQAVMGDGQLYETDNIGQVHLANINGQQVQLQLVNLNDENNTQVYIQIDDNQQLDGLVDNDHLSSENGGLSTPTGHQRQQIEARQINIKQEAMEQDDHTQGHTIVADQYVTGSRNKRANDYMENPSKKLRMDSPRKSNQTEQDESQRKRDWTKKDMETCFGFDDM